MPTIPTVFGLMKSVDPFDEIQTVHFSAKTVAFKVTIAFPPSIYMMIVTVLRVRIRYPVRRMKIPESPPRQSHANASLYLSGVSPGIAIADQRSGVRWIKIVLL